jgi:hypothetical protein
LPPHLLIQNRGIPQGPASDGGVIHTQAAFGHHLFQVAVAQRVPQIPPHAEHNYLVLKMSPSEQDGPVLLHLVYLNSTVFLFATQPFIELDAVHASKQHMLRF